MISIGVSFSRYQEGWLLVSATSFSVLVNDSSLNFPKVVRLGLLSPYLFMIVMEALGCLLKRVEL